MLSATALEDVTVLEMGSFLTAPKPARYLAEFGAEVIKVENPAGAPFRSSQTDDDAGITPMFSIINRGKKNVSIDLHSDEGTAVFKDLAAKADVIVQNLAPGRVEEFGVDYESIEAVNPEIIYCSISGYGQSGPWAEKKSMDYMAQSMSGLPHQNAKRAGHAQPVLSGWFAADELTASYVTTAVLVALINGEGTHIDISLLDCMLGSFSAKAHAYSLGHEINPPDEQETYPGPIGLYPTATDPITIYLLDRRPSRWREFWTLLGLTEWVEEDRFVSVPGMQEHKPQIEETVEGAFRQKSQAEWLELLWAEGFTAAPVLTVEEAFEHEQLESRKVVERVENEYLEEYLEQRFPAMYSAYDVGTDEPPAQLGEHTDEILERAGYNDEELERLRSSETIV